MRMVGRMRGTTGARHDA